MKYLRISAFVAFLMILASCSTFSLLKDRPKGLSSPHKFQSANTAYNPSKSYIDLLEERSRVLLPVVALLLFLFMLLMINRRTRSNRKHLDLDKEEIALMGLLADTVNDLWQRLQAKKRKNVIPLLKKNR